MITIKLRSKGASRSLIALADLHNALESSRLVLFHGLAWVLTIIHSESTEVNMLTITAKGRSLWLLLWCVAVDFEEIAVNIAEYTCCKLMQAAPQASHCTRRL